MKKKKDWIPECARLVCFAINDGLHISFLTCRCFWNVFTDDPLAPSSSVLLLILWSFSPYPPTLSFLDNKRCFQHSFSFFLFLFPLGLSVVCCCISCLYNCTEIEAALHVTKTLQNLVLQALWIFLSTLYPRYGYFPCHSDETGHSQDEWQYLTCPLDRLHILYMVPFNHEFGGENEEDDCEGESKVGWVESDIVWKDEAK